MTRPTWDRYFLDMAKLVATRSTCDRKHVGAVLVDDDRRVVSTGYNGSPAGMPHCDDIGHEIHKIDGKDSCMRTLHAESNALDYAGKLASGCALYVTVIPCYDCTKRIINAGVDVVIYEEYYSSRNSHLVKEFCEKAGVGLFQFGADDHE